jgi:LAS superfamily LD-carboxypeptidase LdcB
MYPSRKFVTPKELEKCANGDIPAHLLSNIKPYGQLYWRAAMAWDKMLEAAKAEGLEFSHVGALRTLKEQESLFASRYTTKATKRVPQITRTYKGKTFFLKEGMAPAGTPGTSKHGWGCAIDIAAVVNKKIVNLGGSQKHVDWLKANCQRFGWAWGVGDPKSKEFEIWHLECFDCDILADDIVAGSVQQATKVAKPTRKEKKGRKGLKA